MKPIGDGILGIEKTTMVRELKRGLISSRFWPFGEFAAAKGDLQGSKIGIGGSNLVCLILLLGNDKIRINCWSRRVEGFLID